VGFKEDLGHFGLAPASVLTTLNDLELFFGWLALQPGFKRAITKGDIEYRKLPEKTVRAATAPADKDYPSLPMVETVVKAMPAQTATERRDQALIAFTAITGARDLQSGFPQCGLADIHTAPLPQHDRFTDGPARPFSSGIQCLEPELGARRRDDNTDQLWQDRA